MNSTHQATVLERIASYIFKQRAPLLVSLLLITAYLGYQAVHLEVATDFSRMIPQEHEYIQAYLPFKKFFGGGNQIKLDVSLKQGTIIDADFLKLLRQINEDVMYIKGVDRLKVRSMVSPETRFILMTEDGFDMGPVVPHRIPETKEGLARIANNISLARLKGLMVSMDMKSTLISAEIYETGVDYLSVYQQLNEIRDKYSTDNIGIHINGFAVVMGFVNDALPKIFGLFALATFITFLILWRCFRRISLAVLPLISGGLSVLWSLGIARLIGMKLDPMTTIVPFLVFAIGVSHGIQMVKRYMEECLIRSSGYDAALHSLSGLMVPGVVALTTDVIGFLTILFVPILVIQDLAITASIGIACIIVANIIALTLMLSFLRNPAVRQNGSTTEQKDFFVHRALRWVSTLTYGKNAYRIAVISALLLLIGLFTASTQTVGDVNPGEPLLWEDSVYNKDAAKIMKDFMLGVDSLSVVVSGKENGTCKDYDLLQIMEQYEWEIGHVPGVTMVLSPLMRVRVVNEMFHEGDIRWRALPKDSRELGALFATAGSTDDSEDMNMGCQAMNIRIFLSDHKGDTIRRVIKSTKDFIAAHPLPAHAKMLLAGGNVGVMAATNEEVDAVQIPMLLLIYLSIYVLCTLIFRNIKAPGLIVAPLFLVSVLATAFMKLFGLGLNVNTLPVASLGVGIGVDYGIYIYSRLKKELEIRASFAEAVEETLTTTGAAVLYTALTLSVGVLTWGLSDLKFQADMGLLLGFIFFTNMIGALVLLPTLVYLADYRDEKQS
ncbi:MAG: RND family transporter [Proteobacteria bacterium]|nr:RND family transporter [Pseudomonadota bacterium]